MFAKVRLVKRFKCEGFGFQNNWCNWVEKAICGLKSGTKVREITCLYMKSSQCTLFNSNAVMLSSVRILLNLFVVCLCSLHLHIHHIQSPQRITILAIFHALFGKVRLGVCKIFMMRCVPNVMLKRWEKMQTFKLSWVEISGWKCLSAGFKHFSGSFTPISFVEDAHPLLTNVFFSHWDCFNHHL